MKNLITVFVLFLFFTSCEKTEDDTDHNCTSNCTTLSGKFVTVNNVPVSNIKVSLKHKIIGGTFGGGYTRKIVSTRSDQNGDFYKKFFIKDNELGNTQNGYFQIEIDDSNIDITKYIRTNNLVNNIITDMGFAIYRITNRDTIIDQTFYIPKKAYIKINLNNFIPQQASDYFEVQTLYPFGPNIGFNSILDSPYSTGFSGDFKANGLNSLLNVFVAEGEKNIIQIKKRKNGINTFEDFPIVIPPNNTIELNYNF